MTIADDIARLRHEIAGGWLDDGPEFAESAAALRRVLDFVEAATLAPLDVRVGLGATDHHGEAS